QYCLTHVQHETGGTLAGRILNQDLRELAWPKLIQSRDERLDEFATIERRGIFLGRLPAAPALGGVGRGLTDGGAVQCGLSYIFDASIEMVDIRHFTGLVRLVVNELSIASMTLRGHGVSSNRNERSSVVVLSGTTAARKSARGMAD